MNLPIRTLRQKVAVINRRLYMERRERISLMSWQTRQIATFQAMGYWVEGNNPAIPAAKSLAFDKIEAEQLKEAEAMAEESERSEAYSFDPENPPEVNVQRGTFERFLGSMGDPMRWAGR